MKIFQLIILSATTMLSLIIIQKFSTVIDSNKWLLPSKVESLSNSKTVTTVSRFPFLGRYGRFGNLRCTNNACTTDPSFEQRDRSFNQETEDKEAKDDKMLPTLLLLAHMFILIKLFAFVSF